MPGGRRKLTNPIVAEERRLIFVQTGVVQSIGSDYWDPKPELLTNAIIELVSAGAAVMFSSSGGGRTIGVKVWEGDAAGDRKWLYDSEELDDWATGIIALAKAAKGQ